MVDRWDDQPMDGIDLHRANPSDFVQSLERGLAVIKTFGEHRSRQTLSEVAQATGLTPASARRFLLTLQKLGYVESDGRYFKLKPKLLELGYSYLASQPWWLNAQGVIEQLATQLNQPCAVGVLDGGSVVFVCYASATKLTLFGRSSGTRLPAYATAIGRALLANLSGSERALHLKTFARPRLTPMTVVDEQELVRILDRDAAQGYSHSDQDLEIGLASLGVPIFDRSNNIFAALSVSFHSASLDPEKVLTLLPVLRGGAAEISQGRSG